MSRADYYAAVRRLAERDFSGLSGLSTSQRAIIAAALPWPAPGRPAAENRGGWSQGQWAHQLDISPTSLMMARRVVAQGEPDLVELVWDGICTVGAAVRVATQLDPDEQGEFVAKVRSGFDARQVAPPALQDASRGHPRPMERASSRGGQHLQMVDQMTRTMAAWAEHTYSDIAALDDSVTPDEARALAPRLTRALRTLNRINRLIRERAYADDSTGDNA